jgi:zinc D-Ala-D-Ala carboxypeptidase
MLTGPVIAGGHFTWEEMTRTDQRALIDANRLALAADEQAARAIRQVVVQLLEPVRAALGPLIVHSGYRCPALNAAIGGSPTSQHMRGEAVDFHALDVPLDRVFEWVRSSNLKWGQLIREPIGAGQAGWIHLSLGDPYRPASLSQQVIR